MKVVIYTSPGGFPLVSVEGSDTDPPRDVAKAYEEAKEELERKEETEHDSTVQKR